MPHDRRSFLRLSALAGGALAGGALAPWSAPADEAVPSTAARPHGAEGAPIEPASRSLRILVLGGTGFIGPYEVAYAVARGHRVTVFNRGRTQADLPGEVEELVGDRNTGDLDALRGREWDAVIDNPTTLPFWVRDAADVLESATGQYVFVSTISAYDARGVSRIDENTPRLAFTEGDPLEVTPDTYTNAMYGPLKAESEREAERRFGDRTTVIRPGLIVGPGDPTDRFTYWPLRIRRGGDILAPGTGDDAIQVIDARDLSEWIIRVVEEGTTGTFNATGPRSRLSMAEQLHGIRGALSGDLDLRFHWVPAPALREHGVQAWSEMTTWFGPDAALSRTRIDRAVEAGLAFRPLAETVRDTLAWWDGLPADRRAAMRAGLDPQKERGVLESIGVAGGNPSG